MITIYLGGGELGMLREELLPLKYPEIEPCGIRWPVSPDCIAGSSVQLSFWDFPEMTSLAVNK